MVDCVEVGGRGVVVVVGGALVGGRVGGALVGGRVGRGRGRVGIGLGGIRCRQLISRCTHTLPGSHFLSMGRSYQPRHSTYIRGSCLYGQYF